MSVCTFSNRLNLPNKIQAYVPTNLNEQTTRDNHLSQLVTFMWSNTMDSHVPHASSEERLTLIDTFVSRGASVHRSRALFIAASLGADAECLRALVRQGGNVNQPDENGNRPIHSAALNISPSVLHLVQLGANWDFTNHNGNKPFDLFLSSVESYQTLRRTNREPVEARKTYFSRVRDVFKALLPKGLKDQFIEDVLPQRMRQMLFLTAKSAALEITEEEGSFFENYVPQPVDECLKRIPLLEYVKEDVLSKRDELYRSFVRGWAQVFEAIAISFERRKLPTVDRVNEALKEMDVRFSEHFFDKGGKIECALEALFCATESAFFDGSCTLWDYDVYRARIEAVTESPLDRLFDVMRAMCFHKEQTSRRLCTFLLP